MAWVIKCSNFIDQLIIGINEKINKKKIVGIEFDYKKNSNITSEDEYMRFLKDSIKKFIGINYLSYVNISFEKQDKKTICVIKCENIPAQNSLKPAYLEGDKVFKRVLNSTEELTGKSRDDFIMNECTL